MNNIELIKSFMTKGITPKGIVQKMVGNNPIFNNLISMAEKNDTEGIEKFARNICEQKGIKLDEELANFRKNFN